MSSKPSRRGGTRPGAGRPPLQKDAQTVLFTMRVTPDQRTKIDEIGGASRLRKFIDRAKRSQE